MQDPVFLVDTKDTAKKESNFKKNNDYSGIIIFFLLWEFIGRIEFFHPGLFPPFSKVVKSGYELFIKGILIESILSSGIRVIAGFCLGGIFGWMIGLLMGNFRRIRKMLFPVISMLYPVPALGWLPLLIIWSGFGEHIPIGIISICSFFPLAYITCQAVLKIDDECIWTARMCGCNEWKILLRVIIPITMPDVFTGMKLEAGMAWRVVLASEMIAVNKGIGAMIMRAESLLRVEEIFFGLLVITVMSVLFEKIICFFERKVTGKWIPQFSQ